MFDLKVTQTVSPLVSSENMDVSSMDLVDIYQDNFYDNKSITSSFLNYEIDNKSNQADFDKWAPTISYFELGTSNGSTFELVDQLDPSYSMTVAVSFLVLSLGGSICNGLIMLAVTCSQSLWKPSYIYVGSVCVADFLMCAVYCPFNAIAALSKEVPPGCYVMGILQNLLVVGSLLSLAAVAVNRYLLVKMTPNQYLKFYSPKPLTMSLVTVWGVGFFYVLLIIGGASDARFDYVVGMCITLPTLTGLGLFTPLQVALVGVPSFTTICYSYYHIWVIFKASQHRVQGKHACNVAASFRLSRNLFIITAVYCVCWVPNLIMAAVDPQYRAPAALHQVTAILALAHSMINPALYLALNRPLTAALGLVLSGHDRPWRPIAPFRHGRLSVFHLGRQHTSTYTPQPLAALVEEHEPRNSASSSHPQLTSMLSHHVRGMWADHTVRRHQLSTCTTSTNESFIMTSAVPRSADEVISSRSSPRSSPRSMKNTDNEGSMSSLSTIPDMSSPRTDTPFPRQRLGNSLPLNPNCLLRGTGNWNTKQQDGLYDEFSQTYDCETGHSLPNQWGLDCYTEADCHKTTKL